MKKRYFTLDFIRGLALINMIIYHTLWDLVYIFNFDINWFKSTGAYIWQQLICYSFILLSGFCFSLGSKRIRRGLIVFSFGALISLVTYLFMPEDLILFGVLTLIGSCMIIFSLLDKQLSKINQYIGLLICIILFIMFRNVNEGYLGFGNINVLKLPNTLYANNFTAYFGFPHDCFYSTDYFSLIPWIFLFATGYFINKIFVKKNLMIYLEKHQNLFVELIGKNSLYIYVLHQPIIYLILLVVAS